MSAEGYMSEDELNWRMLGAFQILVLAVSHYTDDGQLIAICTSESGQEWEIVVRLGVPAPASIVPPGPVALGQN